jgi:hypothetical protein
LSSKLNEVTEDGLSIIDGAIGRKVTESGSQKPAKGEIYLPKSLVFGPNGVLTMISSLSQIEWEIKDDNTQKERSITLDNQKYSRVFGNTNAMRSRKNGEFWLASLKVSMKMRKKKKQLVETPKLLFVYEAIINGRLNRPDGTFQFLRTGR